MIEVNVFMNEIVDLDEMKEVYEEWIDEEKKKERD